LHDGDGDRGVPLMAALPLMDQGAHAAEAATGVYLLGSRGPNAGITPPPGVYFQDDTYFYSGKIGGGKTLPLGGLLLANVSATSWINLPTTLWVTPLKLFELDVQNRMLGTAGYFTLAFPLMVDSGSQISEGKAIKAKF
jgi:hypothetical protein